MTGTHELPFHEVPDGHGEQLLTVVKLGRAQEVEFAVIVPTTFALFGLYSVPANTAQEKSSETGVQAGGATQLLPFHEVPEEQATVIGMTPYTGKDIKKNCMLML